MRYNSFKRSIALAYIASWNVLMFLKIVTKWREIQELKLNNSLTNWAFQKNFLKKIGFVASCSLKLLIFHIVSWNFNFAVNHVTSFSRQKPLKFEKWKQKQKHTIFWNTKFYNPPKFELKQIQTLKVVH